MTTRSALWFTAPQTVEIRTAPLPQPAVDEVLVETTYSAISPGTELLIYRGQAPQTLAADATIDALAGTLDFPLQYGYAAVGRVTSTNPTWDAARVFSFQPHQSHFVSQPNALMRIPTDIADQDAIFLPNTETAVNFVQDGRPQLGERVLVLGAGVVGLLTTAILAQFPLAQLVVIDPLASRRTLAQQLGATQVAASLADLTTRDFDLVYELSGNPNVLNAAIDATGFAGRVVIGSWYGTKTAPVALGGAFHRNRVQLISSQVSSITPHMAARWTKARRFEIAWQQLRRIQPSQLITHRFPLREAAAAYTLLDTQPQTVLQPIFTYTK